MCAKRISLRARRCPARGRVNSLTSGKTISRNIINSQVLLIHPDHSLMRSRSVSVAVEMRCAAEVEAWSLQAPAGLDGPTLLPSAAIPMHHTAPRSTNAIPLGLARELSELFVAKVAKARKLNGSPALPCPAPPGWDEEDFDHVWPQFLTMTPPPTLRAGRAPRRSRERVTDAPVADEQCLAATTPDPIPSPSPSHIAEATRSLATGRIQERIAGLCPRSFGGPLQVTKRVPRDADSPPLCHLYRCAGSPLSWSGLEGTPLTLDCMSPASSASEIDFSMSCG
jgi:hypothetical protein